MHPTHRVSRIPFALTAAALAGAVFAASPARADTVAESRITGVTVYEDRAIVERTATVTVGSGTTRIVLPGFPSGFDPNSLRARSGQVRVMGVDTERVHLAKESLPDADAARKAWDAAKRAVLIATMDADDAKDAWDRLKSIRAAAAAKGAEALAGHSTDVKAIDAMLDLVDEKGRAARRRIVETQTAVETATSAEDAARRTFEDYAASAQREETRVVVTVTAQEAGQATLAVKYMVGNARWEPVYDVRVSDDFSATSLEMTAVVSQQTGEDWSGVPLEVTTAQPAAGASPPEPNPWIVDLQSNEPRGAEREMARRAVPAAPALKVLYDSKDKDDAGFIAPVRRSGVVVAFSAPLPANVKSDGQASRVALGRFDLPPDVRWTAFPKATDKVYVTTKLKNTTGQALPGGNARVFVGPDFVGPMSVADWGMDKEIDVGLGVDREVEVTRESLKNERSTEGVFSKDTVFEREYRITFKNHRDRAIDVRLLDQVPVSQDEELKVETTTMSTPPAKLPDRDAETNRARGVIEWRFNVAAKQEFDLRFGFRVNHPKGRVIIGYDE